METNRSPDKVFAQVRTIVQDIIGQELDLHDREITLETFFNKDLELESIEFVVLFEKLQSIYGKGLNLSRWFANKELDEIIGIRVEDVVEFISKNRPVAFQ